MRCKPVELFIILVTTFLSAITPLKVMYKEQTRYDHHDHQYRLHIEALPEPQDLQNESGQYSTEIKHQRSWTIHLVNVSKME